ncbi:MAG: sigma-70 factor domain-containing protein, partial [bacterium]
MASGADEQDLNGEEDDSVECRHDQPESRRPQPRRSQPPWETRMIAMTEMTERTTERDEATSPVGGAAPDPLESYLREIRDTPVLSSREQVALCEQMEAAEEALRRALGAIPETTRQVVALWRKRQAAGLVTGALSQHHRDGSGRNWSRIIDEQLTEAA